MRCTSICCRLTAFLSDVEGSCHYFEKYLAISRVLYRCANSGALKLKADTHFVYGGDAFDKGGDDLVFAAQLTQLKKDNPDRVTLIAGNRDINKINFTSHFTDEYIASLPANPELVPIPYFMAHSPSVVSYAEFLRRNSNKFSVPRTTKQSYFEWRLEHTMGCAGLFQQRKRYLEASLGFAATDEDVMNSFVKSAQPGGVVREYLRQTQLAAIVDGTLFVHGAVTAENFGFVPSMQLREARAERDEDVLGVNMFSQESSGNIVDVHHWVEALNRFSADALRAWEAQPVFDNSGHRGGGALVAYCHHRATRGKTVVIPSFTDTKTHRGPKFVDLKIVEHCNQSGIFRICAGHKPVGDTPMTIQQPGLTTTDADNSYCAAHESKSADGRGDAVQEILLDGDSGAAIAHGRRVDGTQFDYSLDDPLVGIPMGDDWWSKAILTDGNVLLHRTLDDYFHVEHCIITAAEADARRSALSLQGMGHGETMHRYTQAQLKPKKLKCRVSPKQ